MYPERSSRITTSLLRLLLRPYHGRVRSSRRFTQNAQLLLIAPRSIRPQLPYLSQPASRYNQTPLARLLSTENKRYVKEQVWLATKWTGIIWLAIGLGSISYAGIQLELAERANPTPDEWRFWTRQGLRAARSFTEQAEKTGWIDWPVVGSELREVVKRLESSEYDGKSIQPVTSDALLVEGEDQTAYDVSDKSWPWRAGYFEALMGCATAAEHMDDMVLDRTRRIAFSKEYVIGPSNPSPRPTPSFMVEAPLEVNCNERAFDKPDTFYTRVLNTVGFTTEQKLDAAFAYANWLEFKGSTTASADMLLKALNIAKAGIRDAEVESILDESYVLRPEATGLVSTNMLRAVTGLALHRARSGDVATALPILLSVLRARREAPISGPDTIAAQLHVSRQEDAKAQPGGITSLVKRVLGPPQFPPQPLSCDLAFTRPSTQPSCHESELMLYIGEILFATSRDANEGLSWTRQAVTIAEANSLADANIASPKSKDKRSTQDDQCRECLLTGVKNWEAMLHRLAEQKGRAVAKDRSGMKSMHLKRGWFGRNLRQDNHSQELNDLGGELRQVELLKQRIVRQGLDKAVLSTHKHTSGVR